jgi:hypothetical protein
VRRLPAQQQPELLEHLDIAKLHLAVEEQLNDSVKADGHVTRDTIDKGQGIRGVNGPAPDRSSNKRARESTAVLQPGSLP